MKWECDSRLHRLDTWDRVCFGAISVHADALKIVIVGSPIIGRYGVNPMNVFAFMNNPG